MANYRVRSIAKEKGVRLWQIANWLKVSEATMTRMMRTEMPPETRQRVLDAIDSISADEVQNAE